MGGLGSPCGGCKFLRRKCVKGCVFAPYFCYEDGASHFATIHKVFGASNFSKLLSHLPVHDRCYAAQTITYQAQSRLRDPIYGCVSHIFSLQQQVVSLQAQLVLLREEVSTRLRHEDCTGPNAGCDLMQQEKVLDQQVPQESQSWFHEGCSSSDLGQMSSATDVLAGHAAASAFMGRNESFCNSNESLCYQEVMFPWSVSDYKL